MTFPDLVARLAAPMIFYPERLGERDSDPVLWGLRGAESVFLETEDGVRLHAWWVPASGPPSSSATRAAIFFHGNAGNIASRSPVAAHLSSLGLDVLLVDYRGYGRSGGRPSEQGFYSDARAAYGYVVGERGTAGEELVLIGNSLGAAVAAHLAAERPVGGVVLTGAFRSVPSLAGSIYRWMPDRAFRWSTNRFDAELHLRQVSVPVLVGRGQHDGLIPREETFAVFEAAPEPKRWFEVAGADHNDLWFTAELWTELEAFLGLPGRGPSTGRPGQPGVSAEEKEAPPPEEER